MAGLRNTTWSFTELSKHLASGELAPVYLVAGPEDFLRTEAVRLIREKAARGKEPCDTAELDAAEGDPRKLLDDLRTPSLFAPRRLVLIENAGLLFDERALEPLLQYVEQPSPRTTLVLVAGEVRKSARKASKKPKKEPPKSAAQREGAAAPQGHGGGMPDRPSEGARRLVRPAGARARQADGVERGRASGRHGWDEPRPDRRANPEPDRLLQRTAADHREGRVGPVRRRPRSGAPGN